MKIKYTSVRHAAEPSESRLLCLRSQCSWLKILSATVLLLASLSSHADTINVVESVDFGNTNGSTTDLGTFDIGLNTVFGSVDPFGVPVDNFDFWDAALPTGLEIVSIEIVISDLVGASWRAIVADNIVGSIGPFTSQAQIQFFDGSEGTFSLPAVKPFGAPLGAYPFGSGQYHFGVVTFLASSMEYEWRVNVERAVAVPEPGTLALLGIGLAGIGLTRRRKKA